MCGISVLVHRDGGVVDRDVLEAMNDRVAHRGPDDAGLYFHSCVGLGHRRLAIIDLSPAGHQPMTWRERHTITFNGEIYNYVELRTELSACGYSFDTTSDTEVLLAAYDHWGDECVSHFIGMWAFAIHDAPRKRIFASRDRFGVKPMVYARVGPLFALGSEVKQLIGLPGFERRLDRTSAYRFLAYGELNATERTFFEGVTEVRGGHNLIYDLESHEFRVERWYDLASVKVDPTIEWVEAKRRFREVFLDAVRLRLRSDVEVGACLSGGLDSSAIVVAARHIASESFRMRTISCCWTDPRYDETAYAKDVERSTSFPAVFIYPELRSFLTDGTLDRILWHQDQPIPSASHFSEYKVFEAAAQHNLKVMLDGQGGDESLAGYPEFFVAFLYGQFQNGRVGHAWGEFLKRGQLRGESVSQGLAGLARTVLLPRVSNAKRRALGHASGPSWLTPDFRSAAPEHGTAERVDLASLSRRQILQTSIPYQVHSEDRNSMVHSIESRLPFLDYRVVELMLQLPDTFKIRDGETKAVMRGALEDLLPTSIRHRHHKLGFSAPEEELMRADGALVRDELERGADTWNRMFTRLLLDNFDSWKRGDRSYDPSLFRALSFFRWAKRFDVGQR